MHVYSWCAVNVTATTSGRVNIMKGVIHKMLSNTATPESHRLKQMLDVQIVHAFCRAGKHSKTFKLCCQNQTTTTRDTEQHHTTSRSSDVIIKPFYDSDESVKKAQKCLEEFQEQSSTKQSFTVTSAPCLWTRNRPDVSFHAPTVLHKGDNAGSTKPMLQTTLTRNSTTTLNEDVSQLNHASLHSKIDTF